MSRRQNRLADNQRLQGRTHLSRAMDAAQMSAAVLTARVEGEHPLLSSQRIWGWSMVG